jgi:hypothetical protein
MIIKSALGSCLNHITCFGHVPETALPTIHKPSGQTQSPAPRCIQQGGMIYFFGSPNSLARRGIESRLMRDFGLSLNHYNLVVNSRQFRQ